MAESKQKPASSKGRPAAKAPSKAPSRAGKTSSGSLKAASASKTSSGSVKAESASKTSSGSVKAESASKTSSGSLKAAKKSTPKARAKTVEAPRVAESPKVAPARKARPKKAAPLIEVEPVLMPDVVIVPQQLSMEPLVEETVVEETVVELPKPTETPKPPRPIEVRAADAPSHGSKTQEVAIDGWAAQTLDVAQRSLLEAIRLVVGRVAPKALESAKWSRSPSGAQGSFGFLRDAQLPAPREVIEEASERVRKLTSRLGEQLPLDAIERFLRDTVKRGDGRGSKRAR